MYVLDNKYIIYEITRQWRDRDRTCESSFRIPWNLFLLLPTTFNMQTRQFLTRQHFNGETCNHLVCSAEWRYVLHDHVHWSRETKFFLSLVTWNTEAILYIKIINQQSDDSLRKRKYCNKKKKISKKGISFREIFFMTFG